jgi:hypothetical protein
VFIWLERYSSVVSILCSKNSGVWVSILFCLMFGAFRSDWKVFDCISSTIGVWR